MVTALALAPLAACQAPRPPLRVGSIVFPGYEFLFLARELELLDPRELRPIEMSSSVDVLRALAVGQLEAAQLTLDETVSARAEGLALTLLAVLNVSAGADVVMARPAIRRPEDLRGRRIGVELGATGAVLLGAMLHAHGLRVDEVIKLPVSLNSSADVFEREYLDAVVTAEPWATQLAERGAHRLYDSRATPGLIVDVLAVRPAVLQQRPDTARALVAALFRAREHHQRAPAVTAPMMAPRLQVTPAEVAKVFEGLELPNVARNHALLKPGGVVQQGAERLQAFMVEQRLLRRAAPLADLIDTRFLPAA
jgi:NitT/TauT family transport system substrate-binding protein